MKNFDKVLPLAQLSYYYNNPLYFKNKAKELAGKYWQRGLILLIAFYVLFSKDVSLQFSLSSASEGIAAVSSAYQNIVPVPENQGVIVPTKNKEERVNQSKDKPPQKKKKWKNRKANTFSNLTFVLSPTYGERHNIDPAIVKEKVDNCKNYAKKYSESARKEMEIYGIPASITLAQGILESNAGDSRLSVESNNHFGIKCRSKCKGCTCRNYTDDDIYDMFRVFDSPWESYREHSKLLITRRYKHLLKLKKTDYKGWAHGLKKAGYATDKRYAPKLIQIIEFLDLQQYDR